MAWCCSPQSAYNKVVRISVLQMVISGIAFLVAILGAIIPYYFNRIIANESHNHAIRNYVENYLYILLSLAGIVFGVILLYGAKRKNRKLCKLWMGYEIVLFIISRFDSLFVLASIGLDNTSQFVIASLIYLFGVLLWFGYAMWVVLKFMNGLEVDPEVTGTGFYKNMESLPVFKGPEYYKTTN